MVRTATLPFFFTRGDDEMSGVSIITTRETVHGLLRLEGMALRIQWRLATKTERIGWSVETDHEVQAVQEIVVPVGRMAGATVRRGWWTWPPGLRLILTAADLTALEEFAGRDGLSLTHPAELVLRIRRSDRLAAEESCAELALAVSESLSEGEPDLLRRASQPASLRIVESPGEEPGGQ
jgi:hypothetical protein